MKLQKSIGFTIIETMLFLAVSGFLFVAILASTGNSINAQRYHDSVYSLHAFIQKQYSDIVNVSNDSKLNECATTPNVPRGQSECAILGRFITTADSGKLLNVYIVIGDNTTVDGSNLDDNAVFKDHIRLSKNSDTNSFDVEQYNFEWGVALKNNTGDVAHFSILILRSPNSGIIRTYADPSDDSYSDDRINQLVSSEYAQNEIKTCVDSNGLLNTPRSAVFIHAGAAVQGDVEVLGEASSGC